MTKKFNFYTITPSDHLLSDHDIKSLWSFGNWLAIIVFRRITNNIWINAKTGETQLVNSLFIKNKTASIFNTSNSETRLGIFPK